jgi:hypothetical protein
MQGARGTCQPVRLVGEEESIFEFLQKNVIMKTIEAREIIETIFLQLTQFFLRSFKKKKKSKVITFYGFFIFIFLFGILHRKRTRNCLWEG